MAKTDTNQQAHQTAATGNASAATIATPPNSTPPPPFTPSSLEEGELPDLVKSALLSKTIMDIPTRTVTLSSGKIISVIDSWVAAIDGRDWRRASRARVSRNPAVYDGRRTLDSWIAMRDGRDWQPLKPRMPPSPRARTAMLDPLTVHGNKTRKRSRDMCEKKTVRKR